MNTNLDVFKLEFEREPEPKYDEDSCYLIAYDKGPLIVRFSDIVTRAPSGALGFMNYEDRDKFVAFTRIISQKLADSFQELGTIITCTAVLPQDLTEEASLTIEFYSCSYYTEGNVVILCKIVREDI